MQVLRHCSFLLYSNRRSLERPMLLGRAKAHSKPAVQGSTMLNPCARMFRDSVPSLRPLRAHLRTARVVAHSGHVIHVMHLMHIVVQDLTWKRLEYTHTHTHTRTRTHTHIYRL